MSNYNMKQWVADMIGNHPKKPLPILSFPSVSLLGVRVREMISDSDLQARGMKAVAEKTSAAASAIFLLPALLFRVISSKSAASKLSKSPKSVNLLYSGIAIHSGAPAKKPTTGVPQQRLSAVTIENVSRLLVKRVTLDDE